MHASKGSWFVCFFWFLSIIPRTPCWQMSTQIARQQADKTQPVINISAITQSCVPLFPPKTQTATTNPTVAGHLMTSHLESCGSDMAAKHLVAVRCEPSLRPCVSLCSLEVGSNEYVGIERQKKHLPQRWNPLDYAVLKCVIRRDVSRPLVYRLPFLWKEVKVQV